MMAGIWSLRQNNFKESSKVSVTLKKMAEKMRIRFYKDMAGPALFHSDAEQ